MQSQPHTHKPVLEIKYNQEWTVRYGDGYKSIHSILRFRKGTPTPKQVQRALRQAVETHDKGSLRAREYSQQLEDARQAIPEIKEDSHSEKWGSELLPTNKKS